MSLDPATFVQGGLLDDIDVTIVSARFTEWDYKGKVDEKTGEPLLKLAVLLTLEYSDEDGKLATAEQYLTAGDLRNWQPSEDGTHAVKVGNSSGAATSSNWAIFERSVVDAGFPIDQFGDGDVSALDGMVAHVVRVPQERGGSLKGKKNSAGYDLMCMVVTNIIQMPWENAPQAPATTRPAPGRPAPVRPTQRPSGVARTANAPTAARPTANAGRTQASDNGDAELSEEAAGILVAVLDAKQGTVAKTGIASGAFKPLTGNPNRGGILALITDDNWLYENGEQYGWSFDGKTVSAG